MKVTFLCCMSKIVLTFGSMECTQDSLNYFEASFSQLLKFVLNCNDLSSIKKIRKRDHAVLR